MSDVMTDPNADGLAHNWDDRYRDGDTPWDTGHACDELISAVSQRCVRPCRAIELGCGTGADAVFLAAHGFKVTAVDVSAEAIGRAMARAGDARVRLHIRWANVLEWPDDLHEPFDFVFDRGCYHFVRMHNIEGYVATLQRITRPGSRFLLLVGRRETYLERGQSSSDRKGLPTVSENEIRSEFGSLFCFNWILDTSIPFR